jgi:type I restriction enzyme S subunit
MEITTENKVGYKKTKIGWIPVEWEYKNIKDIAKVGSGNTPSTMEKKYWQNGTIPWLPTGKVNDRIIKHSETFITQKAVDEKSISLLPIDSIVIAMIGQGKTRGKSAILKIEAWINQNFAFLKLNDSISPKFLFFQLEGNYGRIRYEGDRGGSQGSLNLNIVRLIKVAIPPLPEQHKIAEILTTWDEAIEQNQKLIKQLKLCKKSLMLQLLTGKTRLKDFNDEWIEVSYNSIIKEVKRPVKWDDNELYNLISVKRRSGGLFQRESLLGKEILTKNLKITKTGDFLISKMQVVHGASGLTTEKFNNMKISGSYISARSRDEKVLNIEFFSWLSQLPYFYHQTYIASYGVHIEKMTFNYNTFLKLKTKIPSIVEQTAITKVLNTADKEIKAQENYLAQLQAQKKGLMQQLLTGQKRVKIN